MGMTSGDIAIGMPVLVTGILSVYFSGEGNRIGYLFGLINYLLLAYVALANRLHGIFFFYILIFAPLQIKGFVTWKHNSDRRDQVKVRKFSPLHAAVVIVSCLVGSLTIGGLLSLIPGQQLALTDALSNVLSLCAEMLMILRFREAWWVWLSNDVVDLFMWATIELRGGNGLMIIAMTLVGMIMNIRGAIRWNKAAKRNLANK